VIEGPATAVAVLGLALGAWALLLGVVATLFWVRGREPGLRGDPSAQQQGFLGKLMTAGKRVLTGDGTYTVNMIDRGPLAFARAEVATLEAEFDHVALLARTDTLARTGGGNLVAVASPAPIDVGGIAARLARTDTGWGVITGAELDAWVDGAPVLTDDYAPVDQLLTPYVSS